MNPLGDLFDARLPAGGDNFLGNQKQRRLVEAGDGDHGAALREHAGGSAPDAAAASGDESHLVAQRKG